MKAMAVLVRQGDTGVTSNLPEAFVGEGPARPGFQVLFEFGGFRFVRKAGKKDQFPGFEFLCVGRAAFVVGGKTLIYIFCDADVTLPWKRDTLDEIDEYNS